MGPVRAVAALVVMALGLAACSADDPDGFEVADGWRAEVVRDDLVGPTQLALGADDRTVYVVELAGGENAGTGRLLDLGPAGAGAAPVVLVDGLDKPTGLAVLDSTTMLVQEQRDLVRLDLAESGTPAVERTVLVEGLPFNGRSQGTLTLLPGGRVLHTATGAGTGPEVPAESGVLYVTDITGDGSAVPVAVAVGFKNAYAHVLTDDGSLLVTEIGDGRYDGEQVSEELHRIPAIEAGTEPYDGGWPLCFGDGTPILEFGAADEDCADLPAPVALFPPRSTPTGVTVTTGGRVLVALFTTMFVNGGVVEVGPDGTMTEVLTGVTNPQDLLALPDGSVLLTVHGSGQLVRLTPPGA